MAWPRCGGCGLALHGPVSLICTGVGGERGEAATGVWEPWSSAVRERGRALRAVSSLRPLVGDQGGAPPAVSSSTRVRRPEILGADNSLPPRWRRR
uniref:Uncharacterized protein n=1 Tax=Oryza glumipatula TaxID=40148 RepID=A0A0E0BQX8_9ORYZ